MRQVTSQHVRGVEPSGASGFCAAGLAPTTPRQWFVDLCARADGECIGTSPKRGATGSQPVAQNQGSLVVCPMTGLLAFSRQSGMRDAKLLHQSATVGPPAGDQFCRLRDVRLVMLNVTLTASVWFW